MPFNGNSFGVLYGNDLYLARAQFKEAVKLIGMPGVKYFEPLPGKTFNTRNDLNANYKAPIEIGCFFHEHLDQKTVKKLGWVAELQEGSSLIEVPYDTPGLQVGALFEIPAGIDGAQGRLFRVITMENIMLAPVSIKCEIALEYEDVSESTNFTDFTRDDFTVLKDNEGEY